MALSSKNGFRIDCPEAVRQRIVVPAVGLCLLTLLLLLLYWPGFEGQWFLDDFGNIHENPNVHAKALTCDELAPAIHGKDAGRKTIDRPLAYLSLAVNYALGGTDPLGYHIVNFLIHLLTAISIYLLARATLALPSMADRYGGQAHATALFGAVLWAIHPIQVTAVTYIVQRMAAMAALFTVVAILCFVLGRQSQGAARKAFWYGLTAFCGLLALSSKENAVMLPVSLVVYDRVFFYGGGAKRDRRSPWLWAVAAVAVIAIVAATQVKLDALVDGYRTRPFTIAQRLLTEPRIIWGYVVMLIHPISSRFTLLHDISLSTGLFSPWTTLPAIVSLAGAACFGISRRSRNPLFAFGVLFFLVNHVVEGSVLPLEPVFEHRNYLPGIFLFTAAASGVLHALERFGSSRFIQAMITVCTVVVLICAGHTTYARNSLFTDPVAFWRQNVAACPSLHRPRHNLARALFLAGDPAGALEQMKIALAAKEDVLEAQKLVTVYNIGLFYRAVGNPEAAEKAFRYVVSLASRHEDSWYQLALIALERKAPDAAEAIAYRLASFSKNEYFFHVIAGLACMQRNDVAAARDHARMAMRMKDRDQVIYCLLEKIAQASKRSHQAEYFGRLCSFAIPQRGQAATKQGL